jgi:hypothetical protein
LSSPLSKSGQNATDTPRNYSSLRLGAKIALFIVSAGQKAPVAPVDNFEIQNQNKQYDDVAA